MWLTRYIKLHSCSISYSQSGASVAGGVEVVIPAYIKDPPNGLSTLAAEFHELSGKKFHEDGNATANTQFTRPVFMCLFRRFWQQSPNCTTAAACCSVRHDFWMKLAEFCIALRVKPLQW